MRDFGLPSPFLIRRRGSGFNPAKLFADSEPGVWYDPSDLSTLFQDTAGTTPVTAAGQSVGLVLDKSVGLVLGPELKDGSWGTAAGWVSSGYTVTGTGAAATIALTPTSSIAGKWVRVVFNISASSGDVRIVVGSNLTTFIAASGTYSQSVFTSSNIIYVDGGAPFTGTVEIVSVRELPGLHATQATAASRPTYRITSGIPNIEDDLVDDALNWTAPAGNYTVAWVDTAGTVTIQTAQALSGATDAMQAQNMVGYVAIGRALTASETASLTAWLKAKAGV